MNWLPKNLLFFPTAGSRANTQKSNHEDPDGILNKSIWEEIKYERIPAPVVPFSTSENDPGFGAVA